MRVVLIILVASFLTGCLASFVPQIDFDEKVYYKRDMHITHSGIKCDTGVCVFPALEKGKLHSYRIQVMSGDMDALHLSSCHMHRQLHNEGGSFTFKLQPDADTELGESCPFYIQSFDKDQQAHSFGFIDFEHKDLQLPVEARCDGDVSKTTGVSACQGLKGSFQEIHFPVKVELISTISDGKWTNEEICELKTDWKIGRDFYFQVNHVGVCQYQFIETEEPFRVARVSVIGFEKKIVPRSSR